jgi:hypothetical protein
MKELKKEEKALGAKKREVVSELLTSLKNIIRSCEMVDSVRWNQYTPYFNDGEPCYFSVSNLEYKFSDKFSVGAIDKEGSDVEDEYVYEWHLKEFFNKNKDILNYEALDQAQKACDEMGNIHSHLMSLEDALREEFGDHSQITLSKTGVEINHYEHG